MFIQLSPIKFKDVQFNRDSENALNPLLRVQFDLRLLYAQNERFNIELHHLILGKKALSHLVALDVLFIETKLIYCT